VPRAVQPTIPLAAPGPSGLWKRFEASGRPLTLLDRLQQSSSKAVDMAAKEVKPEKEPKSILQRLNFRQWRSSALLPSML
jgi:hypothetical protein